MMEELSCLNYYSSGFKLDSLSYPEKTCTKTKYKNRYNNKEEVMTAKAAITITSSFFSKGGSFK